MASFYEILNEIVEEGKRKQLVHNFTDDHAITDANITINQESYVNFGSCSYLGLEQHPKLAEGVIDALQRYGTQFSTSRTYLSLGLYRDLEKELEHIFKKPLIVSASTTLGHLSAIPVLIAPEDAVIIDMQVHSSVQLTTQLLRAQQIYCTVIPHNDMKALEQKILFLQSKHPRVWYLADGVYSMYGDVAPLNKIETLLNKYKKFYLYIDDAHGMSWTGTNGCGYVRSQIDHHAKMILTTSLNKSFASAGGVIVFPDQTTKNKVKNCGSTLTFSGPIQPPMLGAALASAKLHQSKEIALRQIDLANKIAYTNQLLLKYRLPQLAETPTPLFFIPAGNHKVISNIQRRLKQRGFYLNSASFPAVSMKKGGIRFMVNGLHQLTDIEAMVVALSEEYYAGLKEEGSSLSDLTRQFKAQLTVTEIDTQVKNSTDKHSPYTIFNSIDQLDSDEWQKHMGQFGSNTVNHLAQLEIAFSNNKNKGENSKLQYYRSTDKSGKLLVLAVYSTAWLKEDMLENESTSKKIEAIRKDDPEFLCSHQLMTGTLFSMGRSFYFNHESADFKKGVQDFCQHLQQIAENENCSKILIREFDPTTQQILKDLMIDNGFLSIPLPNNNSVKDLDFTDIEEYIQRFNAKYRHSFKKEVLRFSDQFIVRFDKPQTEKEQQECKQLYLNVFNRSHKLNVFELPDKMIEAMFKELHYDVIRLYEKDNQRLVAVLFSEFSGERYNAKVVGMDYDSVSKLNAYKQILFQSILRAHNLGAKSIDLAFTADLEKKKVGATCEERRGFVLIRDTSAQTVMLNL